MKMGVFSPTVDKKLAFCDMDEQLSDIQTIKTELTVNAVTFLVHSKNPKAPEPLGCTIRSTTLERLNVCCFWNKKTSLATGMPPIVLL